MIRFLLIAAALLLSSADVAFAESGKAWDCTCYCGKVLRPPCSDNACKQACGWRGGGAPGVSVPSHDPLPDLTRNFNAMLDQLARYSGAVQRMRGAAPPRTLEELHARLDQLYAGIRDDLQLSYNQAFEAGLRIGRMEAEIKSLPQRIARLRDETADLVRRTREADARATRMQTRAADYDRMLPELQQGWRHLEDEAHAVALDIHRYLWVASPQELLDTGLHEPPTQRGFSPDRARLPERPAVLPLAGLAPASVPTSIKPDPVTLAPLQGTTNDRINQIRRLEQQFQAYHNEAASNRAALERRRPTFERLEADIRKAAAERHAQSDLLNRAEAELRWARSVLDVARQNFENFRYGFARRAVEFVLIKQFKDKILIPGVRDFLAANGRNPGSFFLNDKTMQEYFNGRRRILVQSGRPWAATIAFVEVQKKALSLINGNPEMTATAAELLAHGSPEQIQQYADQVFARLNRDTVDFIRKAGPVNLPRPLNTVASYALGLASAAQATVE